MGVAVRSWAVAASVVAHAAAIALLLWQFEATASGATSPGLGGIEVALGPLGAAPGGVAAPVVPEVPEAEAAEVREVAEVVPEVPERAPKLAEAVISPAVPETVTPVDSAVEQARPAATAEAPVKELSPIEAVEAADAVEITQARPKVAEPPIMEMAERRPPQPMRKPEPPIPSRAEARQPVLPAAEDPIVTAERPAAVPPGAGGKAGTEDGRDAGSGDGTQGGGLPGASADYLAVLQAWLEKHKEYPRRAQMRRQEGTALLRFVMDRAGRVLSYRLVQSSGYVLLDREVKEMIERAQPLPTMPPEMRQTRLELVVPVQFLLR